MLLLDDIKEIETVELRSHQPDVEDDERRPPRGDFGQCSIAVVGKTRLVPLILENAGDQLADIGFVINDQNVSGHRKLSSHSLFHRHRDLIE